MNYKKYLVVIPGIVLAFVIYNLSQGFNNIIGIELLGYDKRPISTAMFAILFGMLLGNIFQIRESFIKGLNFTQSYILKFGIICLGIQLKPFEFLEFGAIAIPLIIICIVSVLIVIKLIIKKLCLSSWIWVRIFKICWSKYKQILNTKEQVLANIGGFQSYLVLFCLFPPFFGGKVIESVL